MSYWKPDRNAIIFTDTFNKHAKRNKLSEETLKHIIESWILGKHNILIEINSNKLIWSSEGGQIKIFSVKIPSKEKGMSTGKSGGYRLVVTHILPEKKTVLEEIHKRSSLNSKKEKTQTTNSKNELKKYYEKYIELNRGIFDKKD